MALAPKHTMRQGGRLPGSVGSGRSVHGTSPEWLTHIAMGRADSTRASDWPPLAVGTLHHRGANPSGCGTAPRARLAASIPGDRALCQGGAVGERLRTQENTVPRSVCQLSDGDGERWALHLATLVNFAYA